MNRPYAEVIGDPIAHSKSPLMHNFWLRSLGIDADYRAVHVTADQLPDYFAARRADPAWRGCNVTVPHKQAVLDHLNQVTDDARAIGAANTIGKTDAGDLRGDNTDAVGFLRPLANIDLRGRHAGIIGAGGAARAILHALSTRGVGRITLYNRTAARAEQVLRDLNIDADIQAMDGLRPQVDLLVNATTLGMTGAPPLAVDLGAMPPDGAVCDIVYAPLETALLAAARARGLTAIDGLGMLIGQAMAAFRIFFQQDAPHEREDELRAVLTS